MKIKIILLIITILILTSNVFSSQNTTVANGINFSYGTNYSSTKFNLSINDITCIDCYGFASLFDTSNKINNYSFSFNLDDYHLPVYMKLMEGSTPNSATETCTSDTDSSNFKNCYINYSGSAFYNSYHDISIVLCNSLGGCTNSFIYTFPFFLKNQSLNNVRHGINFSYGYFDSIAPTYVSPTPSNNTNVSGSGFTVRVLDSGGLISSANISVNGVNSSMTNISSTLWQSVFVNGTYDTQYNFTVYFNGGLELETRTIYLREPSGDDGLLRIFPVQGLFAQILTLSLLFGYFIFS